MEPATSHAGTSKLRILRPFLIWIFLSLLLFACDYHLKQARHVSIQFAVSIEGRAGHPDYFARLNDKPFEPGHSSGLGDRRLVIQAQDAEPFSTNVFVWYGGIDLGRITLARTRGTLDLNVKPAAQVTVKGEETNQTFIATTHESVPLPTGRYKVSAQFARLKVEDEVVIRAHDYRRLSINPGIVAFHLTSQPTNAEFELQSEAPRDITIRSNTPALLSDLPAGDYSLRIWQGDYRKYVPVRLIAAEPTNELAVAFDYAQLTITSEPTGAEISVGENRLGVTPATLRLRPDSSRIALSKDGFTGTNLLLVLRGSETQTVSVTLLSLAYLEAVKGAEGELSSFAPDYGRALAAVEKALQIRPTDSAALTLKRTIQFGQQFQNARQSEQNGDRATALAQIEEALKLRPDDREALAFKENLKRVQQQADERRKREERQAAEAKAAARLAHPQKILQTISDNLRYANLFQSQTMPAAGKVDEVLVKVQRALKQKPEWSFVPQRRDSDTVVIHGELNSIGAKRHLIMILGQTTDTDVVICFKLILRVLDSNVQVNLKGISDESYVPLHPKYVSGFRQPDKENAAAVQDIKQRITDELR